MADEGEPESTETPEGPEPPNPAAVSIALARTSPLDSGAVDAEAAAFLRDQRRLINLQAEHLHEQRQLQLAHLRVRRWKDRMSLSLQVLAVFAGAVLIVAFAGMAWHAHEDHGLLIDAFEVPPELAADGVSGSVLAQRFLDKFNSLQTATDSDRPAASFQNNWGDDIKVEIPETGLKLGEVQKLLRDFLGNVSHVTGDVYKTATGIALTARLGDAPPRTFEGSRADLDLLLQQAAEAVYRFSQPYRYSDYLEQHGRSEQAIQVISDLATGGARSERGWAYAEWAVFDLNDHANVKAARAHGELALQFSDSDGAAVRADIALIGVEVWSGQDEQALVHARHLDPIAHRRSSETTRTYYEQNSLISSAYLASLVGDFKKSADQYLRVTMTPEYQGLTRLSYALASTMFALNHDPVSAQRALAPLDAPDDTSYLQANAISAFMGLPAYWIAAEHGDWSAALQDARAADTWLESNKAKLPVMQLMQLVWIRPLQALAMAKAGDVSGADALIDPSAADCYLCLRVRGLIAAERSDWPAADRWFGEAVRQAPSVPFAYADWGAERLQRNDADGAMAMLQKAHEVGPNFAEPLELMGEALMRKGDFRGAITKFSQAEEAAPRWGRNQLRWSESLLRIGYEREAKAHLDKASNLSLSSSDRGKLETLVHELAKGA
jgi:tetratricopeptide (TPR) repeat protein